VDRLSQELPEGRVTVGSLVVPELDRDDPSLLVRVAPGDLAAARGQSVVRSVRTPGSTTSFPYGSSSISKSSIPRVTG